MNKKIPLLFLALVISGCGLNTVPPNINNNYLFPQFIKKDLAPTKREIAEYDKEYAFVTKKLTNSYINRKLTEFLSVSGSKLLKELKYLRFKQHDELKNILINNVTLYDEIAVVPEVSSNQEPGFRFFFDIECNPRQSEGTAGEEFQVNTYITSNQQHPNIAMNSIGKFVVAWESYDQAGNNNYGIYAQRYNPDGTPLGDEFPVNTTISGAHYNPAVGINDSGEYIIAWEGHGVNYGIHAQRFNNDGSPNGSEFAVSDGDFGSKPSVALSNDGKFIICWEAGGDPPFDSGSVYFKNYDINGNSTGSTIIDNNGSSAKVAINNDNSFIVAWAGSGTEDSNGIYSKIYNSNGSVNVDKFPVNSQTNHEQDSPSVAVDASGNFVIAWQSLFQDGDNNHGIFAQRFNGQGTKLDSEFQVNTYFTSAQRYPSVSMNDTGNFIIAWESYDQDGADEGIFAQKYNTDGSVKGDEFQVSVYYTGHQPVPSVAIDNAGDFVAVWTNQEPQDGDGPGVFGRRFSAH
jgi:hypothetical protein